MELGWGAWVQFGLVESLQSFPYVESTRRFLHRPKFLAVKGGLENQLDWMFVHRRQKETRQKDPPLQLSVIEHSGQDNRAVCIVGQQPLLNESSIPIDDSKSRLDNCVLSFDPGCLTLPNDDASRRQG